MTTYTDEDCTLFAGDHGMVGDFERGFTRDGRRNGIVYFKAQLLALLEVEERGRTCKEHWCSWPLLDEDPTEVYCDKCFHFLVALVYVKQGRAHIEGTQVWYGSTHMGQIPLHMRERFDDAVRTGGD